jgi:hypothetical protein
VLVTVVSLIVLTVPLHAQQFDNDTVRSRQRDQVAVHNAAALLGIGSTGPFGIATELTELSANLALKIEPPVLEAPARVTVYPDTFNDGSYACSYAYDLPQQSALYEDLYGFGEIRSLPNDWGPFGKPLVEHRHSAVLLSLAGVSSGSGELVEDDHLLTWIAETQLSLFWDVELPSFLLGFGIASEAKNGRILARTGGRFTSAGARRARTLKQDLVRAAIDIGKRAGLDGAEFLSKDVPGRLGDEEPSARHTRPQTVRVWDVHPPVFRDPDTQQIIETHSIAVEASDFGGARFRRIDDLLKEKFEYIDPCGKTMTLRVVDPPSLIPIDAAGVDIEWIVEDQGHYNHADLRFDPASNHELYGATSLRTRFVQHVVVADTQPPLLLVPDSFARYSLEDIVLNGDTAPLGGVSVIDLADPNPTVTNDAPDVLTAPTVEEGGRRYVIKYAAEDASGNRTVAAVDNPEQYTQIVTLKAPGTNTAPAACDPAAPCNSSVATVSNEPVSILLTGTDTDLIDGRVDPLAFTIADQPGNGQFVAPLFPYFIEDFRSKPVETPRDMDPSALACPAPEDLANGRELEARLGLLDINDHIDYVTRCYCSQNIDPPTDFINQPDYVHIADDGLGYVADDPFVCDPSTGGTASTTEPRISTWLDNELQNELFPRFNNSNNSRLFDVDEEGRIWLLRIGIPTGSSANVFINTWDRNLEEWYSPDGQSSPTQIALNVEGASNPFRNIDPADLISAHADIDNNVIYVSDKETVMVFSLFGPVKRPALADLIESTDFNGLNVNIAGEGNCDTISGLGSRVAFTMNSDSAGNLYVADSCADKIHKFEPSALDLSGNVKAGAYIGWMGKCIGNATDPDTGVEFNSCIVADQHSAGYQCTDATCIEDMSIGGSSGSGPGQFDIISHLNIDPHDSLYVADFRNRRIQRFGPDGVFAGEAQSVGDGISSDGSFVLGNMGPPSHVSVNGDSFHVLEARDEVGDFFLHIFKTLPFYDVTPASARVDYVSDINFRGADRFTYFVDDGIDQSGLATVAVDVGATQRPPEDLRSECFADAALQTQMPCTFDEDGSIFLRLLSSDPDGFVGFGGFDSHTFTVLEGPASGTLELQSSNANNVVYRYVPDQHFNGAERITFQASDGDDEAAKPGFADIVVLPVEDRVEIDVPSELRIARGFEQFFEFEYNDPDRDPDGLLEAHSIDWGDGVFSGAVQGWTNIGISDENGDPIDPQRDTSPGRGILIGAHTYVNPTIGFSVCMQDNADLVCADLQGTSNLVLEDVTHVSIARDGTDDIQPDTDTIIRINVTNDQPDGWAGLAADATLLTIDPPDDLSIVAVPAECTFDAVIDCTLGSLDVGEIRSIDLVVRVDLAAARERAVFIFETQQTDAGPRLDEVSYASFQLEISDRDGDGTIDADDGFPDDDRYATDQDGDGMPDEWETQFGLDTSVDDSALDPDGDGFDHFAEFELGGKPLGADAYLDSDLLTSGLDNPESSDLFGIVLAAGDIDNDGFSDVAIGAPAYAGTGAVFVYSGVDPVASESLLRIDGNGLPQFGRSVAVGDVDGNGFADLAVSSIDAVSIFLTTASGLPPVPDLTIFGAPGDDLGRAIVIADIDDDGLGDLIYSSPQFTQTSDRQGKVSVHRASGNWWTVAVPKPSKAFLGPDIPGFQFGTSLAVGDIDDDARADLLVGSAFSPDAGHVHGFLGATQDWTQLVRTDPDFELNGEASGDRFGHSVVADGDADNDGIDDVLVGAYRNGVAGAAYLYSSRDAYWTGPQPEPQFVQKLPGRSAGDQYGVRVAFVPPGLGKTGADLVVGANRAEQGTEPDEGLVDVFDGGQLPAEPVRTIPGTARDMLGYYVIGAGDINGDGGIDFAAGAPDLDLSGYSGDGGYVRLFFGGRAESQPDGDDDGASDTLDNCPVDPNTAQENADGDDAGDACDAFPEDPQYTTDSDDDGMPDDFESDNGLDPQDPTDAPGDFDGDGRSNLDEFLAGSDIANDDVPPHITPPANLTVEATGLLTPIDIGTATATDALDGSVEAAVDRAGPYRSGRHLLTWAATDAAGNTATVVQQLDVLPMADFAGSLKRLPEGATTGIEVELSGDAPTYPVTVTIETSGNAIDSVDYVLADTTLSIGTSNRASLTLEVIDDAMTEGVETLMLEIGAIENGTPGTTAQQTIELVEGNVLPALRLSIRQNGELVTTAVAGDGTVVAELAIDDPNPLDSHLIEWSGSDNALVPAEGFTSPTFSFDPSSLVPGTYRLRANVVDSGAPLTVLPVGGRVRIVAAPPALSDAADQDGDGIGDASDGAGDVDQDGVPNYLDSSNRDRYLNLRSGEPALLQTDAGLSLDLGSTAFSAGNDADVTFADVADFGANGGPAQRSDDNEHTYPAGLVDFEVHGLAVPGAAAQIVIPLPTPVPDAAGYRKYVADTGWQDFVENGNNALASTPGLPGICPAPGHPDYRPGLVTGDHCIQLTVEDGGPNDADATADRVIRDPGGIATRTARPALVMEALSVGDTRVQAGAKDVPMLRFRLSASSSGSRLQAITLSAAGSGNDAGDVVAVTLWLDVDGNGAVSASDTEIGSGSYSVDNGSLRLVPDAVFDVPAGDSNYLVTYDF